MGGAAIPPIPDWKTYKVGDHTVSAVHMYRQSSPVVLPLVVQVFGVWMVWATFAVAQYSDFDP